MAKLIQTGWDGPLSKINSKVHPASTMKEGHCSNCKFLKMYKAFNFCAEMR
jgi:hypothetical protein